MKTRKFSRKSAGALSIMMISGLVLAACSDSGESATGSSDSGSESGEATEGSLTVGLALSQSGNMVGFDAEPGQAALLAISQMNESGGIGGREVKVIEKDVRSDSGTMGVVTQELLDSGIDILVTPCDFDLSASGLQLAQAEGVPAVSICAGDPKTGDTLTIGDYAFTANAGSDVEGATGASWAYNHGWTSAYVLQDEAIEYTKSTGAYFKATFEELGGEIVGEDSFPGGDSVNISSQVSRIRALSGTPDVIYVASWNPAGATAIKQIRDAGIDIPVLGPAALDGQTLLDIVGDVDEVYYTAFACIEYCEGFDSDELDSFVADFTEFTGNAPSSSYALHGYNMMLAIQNALEGQDGDLSGEDIKNALESSSPVTTPIGEMTYFSDTCHKILDFPMSIVGVSGGSMQFVEQHRVESLPDLGDANTCASAA